MTMLVTLSHARNPDIDGGYWNEPVDSGKKQRVTVADLADASKVCRTFIERNDLGGGNWTGGEITKDGKVVAHVSYNGRVWDGRSKDWTNATTCRHNVGAL